MEDQQSAYTTKYHQTNSSDQTSIVCCPALYPSLFLFDFAYNHLQSWLRMGCVTPAWVKQLRYLITSNKAGWPPSPAALAINN